MNMWSLSRRAHHPEEQLSSEQVDRAGGAGTPSDALDPLLAALESAAKTAGKAPAGDPNVARCVQLGWLMADILAGRAPAPYSGDLALGAQAGRDAQAISLAASVKALGLSQIAPPDAVTAALRQGDAQQQARTWEPKLAGALLGADVRFAKAYGVGHHLNGLANTTEPQKGVFGQPAGLETIAALDDLSTALPPHAARGVANSIRRLQSLDAAPGIGALGSQCELWRTILTGEKDATELLEPENYIDAAEQLALKLRAVATLIVKRYAFWVGLAVALFLGGVAVLVFLPKQAGTTVAGVSGVLAALGLSWKGIGGTLGKLAGRLESPLWGAELDGAVTDAVTIIKSAKRSRASVRELRSKAPTGDYAGRAARGELSR